MKLIEEYDLVLNNLHKLRKLEKKSWKKMLLIKRNEFKNHEIVQINEIFNKQKIDLVFVSYIDNYILSTNIGNFE